MDFMSPIMEAGCEVDIRQTDRGQGITSSCCSASASIFVESHPLCLCCHVLSGSTATIFGRSYTGRVPSRPLSEVQPFAKLLQLVGKSFPLQPRLGHALDLQSTLPPPPDKARPEQAGWGGKPREGDPPKPVPTGVRWPPDPPSSITEKEPSSIIHHPHPCRTPGWR